jgi:hypothetical protein
MHLLRAQASAAAEADELQRQERTLLADKTD